jgi:rubrerythrin
MSRVVKWEEGDPDDVLWVCPSCDAHLHADCVGDHCPCCNAPVEDEETAS